MAELFGRSAQALTSRFERLPFNQGELTDARFWRLLVPELSTQLRQSTAALHEHFAHRSRPHFFAGADAAQATATLLRDRNAESMRQTIGAANTVQRGQFDLLGYTGLSFGQPIDWHLDPLRGIRSPRIHWSLIPYLDRQVVGDHKLVWELNRHQHLTILGRAYQLTGDESYGRTFADHVTSWMDENPPKMGINWSSSLEVAYRSISWLWALALFRDSAHLTAELRLRLLKCLYVHATHLARYLSTYFSPNTHLTGEALGLWYAGVLLPEFRGAERWRELGWSILAAEINRQVLDDGVYFEQATHYHRYTAEIYLHAVLLAQRNSLPVPPALLRRMRLLIDHLAAITRPDGSIPIVGDDDGGRVVALESRRCNDVRSVLAVAAVVLREPAYKSVAAGITEELVWLVGSKGITVYDQLRCTHTPAVSRAYPAGGVVVMRDGGREDAHVLVIDAGPHGSRSGGHSHADALSFDLTAFGSPVFVDPGTYSYVDSELRDHFRGTAAHNTVAVDGLSSAEPAGPFSWATRADAHIDRWWTSEHVDFFAGHHDGYARLADPVRHNRRILFVKRGYWIIWDSLQATGEHEVVASLHAAAGVSISAQDSRSAWLRVGAVDGEINVLVAAFGDVQRFDCSSDWVSSCYGARSRAPVCRVVSSGIGRRDIVSVVVPARSRSSISVEPIAARGGLALLVRRSDVEDFVTIRHDDEIAAADITTDAEMSWVRRTRGSREVELAAMLEGRSLRAGDLSLASVTTASMESQRDQAPR